MALLHYTLLTNSLDRKEIVITNEDGEVVFVKVSDYAGVVLHYVN